MLYWVFEKVSLLYHLKKRKTSIQSFQLIILNKIFRRLAKITFYEVCIEKADQTIRNSKSLLS